jgi:hypothetical protein
MDASCDPFAVPSKIADGISSPHPSNACRAPCFRTACTPTHTSSCTNQHPVTHQTSETCIPAASVHRRPLPAANAAAAAARVHRAPASKLPPRQPAELSNSFIITTIQDLQPALINGVQQTPCEYAVKRARSIGMCVTAGACGYPQLVLQLRLLAAED